MILVLIAWILILSDLIMTYSAIKLYGFGVESNRVMRALIKADDKLVTLLTVLYMIAILYFHVVGLIDVWGWIVIIGFNVFIFINNVIWFVRYYKG